jgi:hypothetical protein
MRTTAKLFKNGQSQAVRLPKELALGVAGGAKGKYGDSDSSSQNDVGGGMLAVAGGVGCGG